MPRRAPHRRPIVNYGASGQARADLVVANLKQANPSQDSRNDTDVEVVIGRDFRGVAPTAEVLANLAKRPPAHANLLIVALSRPQTR